MPKRIAKKNLKCATKQDSKGDNYTTCWSKAGAGAKKPKRKFKVTKELTASQRELLARDKARRDAAAELEKAGIDTDTDEDNPWHGAGEPADPGDLSDLMYGIDTDEESIDPDALEADTDEESIDPEADTDTEDDEIPSNMAKLGTVEARVGHGVDVRWRGGTRFYKEDGNEGRWYVAGGYHDGPDDAEIEPPDFATYGYDETIHNKVPWHEVHTHAMGDPQGFASHFDIKKKEVKGDTTDFLKALGHVEPGLVDLIMSHVPKTPTDEQYRELSYLKGFKAREFKEQVKAIQMEHIKGKKGKGAYYSWKNIPDLVKSLRRQGAKGQSALDQIAKHMEAEHKRITPLHEEHYRKVEERRQKKDITKVNVGNIYGQHYEHDDFGDMSDYTGNILEGLMYSGELSMGDSEAKHERYYEKVHGWQHQRTLRSIGGFIKGKKFKNAKEAYEAYKDHFGEGDYYAELDRWI